MSKKNLIETIDAIAKDRKTGKDYIQFLDIVAQLMLDLQSGYFKGASYQREFIIDRLKLNIYLKPANRG